MKRTAAAIVLLVTIGLTLTVPAYSSPEDSATGLEMQFFEIEYRKIDDVKNVIEQQCLTTAGKIAVDRKTIFVTDTPQSLKRTADIVEHMDKAQRLIDVRISVILASDKDGNSPVPGLKEVVEGETALLRAALNFPKYYEVARMVISTSELAKTSQRSMNKEPHAQVFVSFVPTYTGKDEIILNNFAFLVSLPTGEEFDMETERRLKNGEPLVIGASKTPISDKTIFVIIEASVNTGESGD